MQPWVDRHPILFVLSDFLFVYLTVSFVISWWSGWAVLARLFRLHSEFTGPRWRFQSGQMRWLCGYRLSDGWRQFRGPLPRNASLFPSFPSSPVHPMERGLHVKGIPSFCKRSTLSARKRNFHSLVGAGATGGPAERCCRARASNRDARIAIV